MEFLSAHLGEVLLAVCGFIGGIVGAWQGVKVGMALHNLRISTLETSAVKFQTHIENTEVHYHRRDGDPTGLWPKMGGNQQWTRLI